jgi:hypothetical protein
VKAPANQPTALSQENHMAGTFKHGGVNFIAPSNATAAEGAALTPQAQAYNRVQQDLGAPLTETLQIDDSINALGEAVDYHIEMVQALLRRLYQATGDIAMVAQKDNHPEPVKVPLCYRIDSRRDQLVQLSNEVAATIRALQI